MINLLLIILGFGILIFVHEAGHFLAAKWARIRTEVFAIGMGTAVLSWRKGIGVVWGSSHAHVVAKTGKAPRQLSDEELARHGIGETEYSLRWLPIGGFVKMLGQDDTDPEYVSSHSRSYNVCPIGKRMIVVSAGVVANLLFAVGMFVVAFMVGVRFEAPVIGGIIPGLPAATTLAENAAELEALGVESLRLQPGDEIVSIDGGKVRTFADVRIASAMSRPGVAIAMQIRRPGVQKMLTFNMLPRKDPVSGLLSVGLAPASSTLLRESNDGSLKRVLETYGIAESLLVPGMRMIAVAGTEVTTYGQFSRLIERSDGRPVTTLWQREDSSGRVLGPQVSVDLELEPEYQVLAYHDPDPESIQQYERGLLGLTPLVEISEVIKGSPNEDILQRGDVILRVGSLDAPRLAEFRETLKRYAGGPIDLLLLREGVEVAVQARVDGKGKLNVLPRYATRLGLIARPMKMLGLGPEAGGGARVSPVADLGLVGGSRFDAVNGEAVSNWRELRAALGRHTAEARAAGVGAAISLSITDPSSGHERETVTLQMTAADVAGIGDLPWRSVLPGYLFEPLYTKLAADGNPWRAAVMGFEQTSKFIVLTYLTLDRLVRGSVGVEQIHGPIGIVHVGAKVADRGFMYLIFFLGIISVNLAVINFLPLPIVDGGLFLFLVYEKLKGRPPSLAFQNAATILGIAMIGLVLVVVTWNDVVRLLS